MEKSILNDKWILVVDNQPAVLMALEQEILRVAPNCHVDQATHYKKGAELMASFTYDLVILDGLGFRSPDLLARALNRFPPPPVVLLISPYINSEALKGFVKMGARVCPLKENFREIIPFLENVVRHENVPGWRRLLEDLTGHLRPSNFKSQPQWSGGLQPVHQGTGEILQ